MSEQRVLKELNERLLAKGYDAHYQGDGLHKITDWLRSKGLHVFVDVYDMMWDWNITALSDNSMDTPNKYEYPTHDIALLAGITQAVEMVDEIKQKS